MHGTGFDPWVRKIHWEEEMATHSSIFVWEITWTDESGVLDLRVAKSRTQLSTAHKQKVTSWLSQYKLVTPGLRWALLVDNTSHMSQFTDGKWHTFYVILLGEDSQKPGLCFLQTLPRVPFFFCCFCFVSFWQNKSHTEFCKFLSLIKEPGGGLGYPRHTPLSLFCFFIPHFLTGFPWEHILNQLLASQSLTWSMSLGQLMNILNQTKY